MKKRFLLVALAVLMCVAFVACNDSTKEEAPAETTEETVEETA